jgi:hypothetical protein
MDAKRINELGLGIGFLLTFIFSVFRNTFGQSIDRNDGRDSARWKGTQFDT